MPFTSLEIKKRSLKAGGVTRLFDKIDTKLTDQKVLEMESEEFNSKFKVEVADNGNDILIRRMFSPKIMDMFNNDRIPVYDNVIFRDGRTWIADEHSGVASSFSAIHAAKVMDYMLFRAQHVAKIVHFLAKEVDHNIQQGGNTP